MSGRNRLVPPAERTRAQQANAADLTRVLAQMLGARSFVGQKTTIGDRCSAGDAAEQEAAAAAR